MANEPRKIGKAEAPDSPKVTLDDYLAAGGSSVCVYNGDAYAPGSQVCMLGSDGTYTTHICVGGKWVSTGEPCEPV